MTRVSGGFPATRAFDTGCSTRRGLSAWGIDCGVRLLRGRHWAEAPVGEGDPPPAFALAIPPAGA